MLQGSVDEVHRGNFLKIPCDVELADVMRWFDANSLSRRVTQPQPGPLSKSYLEFWSRFGVLMCSYICMHTYMSICLYVFMLHVRVYACMYVYIHEHVTYTLNMHRYKSIKAQIKLECNCLRSVLSLRRFETGLLRLFQVGASEVRARRVCPGFSLEPTTS